MFGDDRYVLVSDDNGLRLVNKTREKLLADRQTLQQLDWTDASMEAYQNRLRGIEQRCSNLEHI